MKNYKPSVAIGLLSLLPVAAHGAAPPVFSSGNLVVSVEGNGVFGALSGSYVDNQAAPLTLFQYTPTGTSSAVYSGSLVLPQAASGANLPISGEYGSTSEGVLQLSSDRSILTIAGYGINASIFNANPTAYGTAINDPTKPTALAQSGSLTGQSYTPVARVIATIDANGTVDTSTALFNVFNGNNPRSVYSADDKSFYVSGQGSKTADATAGVFYAQKAASSATAITGLDTTGKTASQDTRDVQVVNGQLYVSTDSKGGSNSARDFVGTLGATDALPTTLANGGNGPTMLPGFGNSGGTGKVILTAATSNTLNLPGQEINLSPNSFFFASPTVLYVADSGNPKNDSVTKDSTGSTLGDGGLQKWTLVGGTWTLSYTLSSGLKLVPNSSSAGTTGLFALTGMVTGDAVSLYATNATIGDTDPTFLYGITDSLSAPVKAPGEAFSLLATAPVDSTFKGIAFAPQALTAPAPEPATWALMIIGFLGVGLSVRCRKKVGTPVSSAV